MNRKLSFILLIFIVSLTGCVYLRLLQVKRQLNDFEQNFLISDRGGLTLIFKNPVLKSGDIVWLMKSEPVSMTQTDEGDTWEYVLEKQYVESNNEKANYDIPVRFYFRDDKLVEMTFPERFLKNLSKPMLIKMLGSMGKSKISKSTRSAGTEFKGSNLDELPKKKYIISVLGKPFKDGDSGDTNEFTYFYNFKENDIAKDNDEFNLKMTFSFADDDETLAKAEYNFNGLTMTLNLITEEKVAKE